MFATALFPIHRWPTALVSAARLQGTLITTGGGLRPAAWPDTPYTRCAILQEFLTPRFVAIDITAAWILGAADLPGEPLRFSTARGRVPPTLTHPDARFSEYALSPAEILHLGQFKVTLPVRTAFDLLRAHVTFSSPRRSAVLALSALAAFSMDDLLARTARSNPAERNRVVSRCSEVGLEVE